MGPDSFRIMNFSGSIDINKNNHIKDKDNDYRAKKNQF